MLGTIAGLLYGLSATLMKPVVEGLHADGLVDVIAGWEFWVWAIAGIVGFFVQQLSLATSRLVPSVATVSVANPVVSVLLGAPRPAGAARQRPALACGGRGRCALPRRSSARS